MHLSFSMFFALYDVGQLKVRLEEEAVFVSENTESTEKLIVVVEAETKVVNEQKEIAAARAANPQPTMPPILARRPSCGERSSSETDHLILAVMQSQNRQLREAVLTANQRNAARKKELEKERTAAARKLAPPPVPPPRRARSAAPRVPAHAYQYELRKLRAEFAVAQRDSAVLQAEQALLLRALHKAADTRQAYAEMRDRQSESERRAHTPPPAAASAPRRRRR